MNKRSGTSKETADKSEVSSVRREGKFIYENVFSRLYINGLLETGVFWCGREEFYSLSLR